MLDWKALRDRHCTVPVNVAGQNVTARMVSGWHEAMLADAHPAPGIPTEPDGKGGVIELDQSPEYMGLKERHEKERTLLRAALMLGFTGSGMTQGNQPLAPEHLRTREDWKRWVESATAEAMTSITLNEAYDVLIKVTEHRKGVGDAAKKLSSSTPDSPPME